MIRWRESFPVRQLRARPLACCAAAFLTGLIAGFRFRIPLPACLAASAAALAGIAVLKAARRRVAAMVALLALCFGAARIAAVLDLFPPVETRYSVHMVGRVVSEPFTHPNTGRVISKFRLESADGEPSDLTLRLYLRGDAEPLSGIAYGQRLSLTGHIWANDPVTNPYEFDFGAYLHRNGMSAIATAKIGDVEILDVRRDAQSLVIEARSAIARRIDALFPKNAAMVRALVLGDRSLLSEETREAMNATGTAHLISISGLHVTVLAMVLAFGLGQVMPQSANLIVVLPLCVYGALIGFTAPFVRALVMFAVFSLGRAAGLPSDGVTRLSAAMLGYLAAKPLAILDGGFILSFSASAGILLLTPPMRSLLRMEPMIGQKPALTRSGRLRQRAAAYFPSLLCASLAAQLATLPAVIACFGVQSVVSIPFNLVCVPLCMLGYGATIASLLLGAIVPPLGALFAACAEGLFSAMLAVTRFSAALPLTSVHVGRYPWPLILLHAALILAASHLSGLPSRVRRLLPLSLAVVAGLSSLNAWLFAMPFSVTFLDAGQADCAVLRTQGHTYVFDAGDTYTPLADYLSATCLHLDGVFLSHPHQDHAGGLEDILTSFKPDAIYVPAGWFDRENVSAAVTGAIELARSMNVEIVELASGDAIALSRDAVMTVWNPDPDAPPDEVNDMSLLQRVEADGASVLFTGDLTVRGEPEAVPDCDVLKVAHHGADNATSARFLDAASPEIAVISVGENSFGHPAGAVLERLEDAGAEILRTDERGAITLTRSGGGWRADTFLEAPDELE